MEAICNDITLHYERIGAERKEGPVVLFLHEALGSIAQWKTFPEELCAELNLPGIVYERQGHGASTFLNTKRRSDYLHNYALKELPAFLEAISEDRPILLVGHSDGGTIALLYASAFPNKVAGIVTMAAHVINEPETIQGIAPAIKAYKAGKLDGLNKYHGEKTEALFYAWADIWRSPSFADWDITNEISNCSAKGLFIQGADDQYGTKKQLQLISQHYNGKHQTNLLDRCGHHPHLEQSESVIALITDWWNANY
ncbi:MAG: alpha/beta hydrolase [bacterium]|nr:alpha/beta hydrolase [bacterium]